MADAGGRLDIGDHCVPEIDEAVDVIGEKGPLPACGSPTCGWIGHRLAQRMMIDENVTPTGARPLPVVP